MDITQTSDEDSNMESPENDVGDLEFSAEKDNSGELITNKEPDEKENCATDKAEKECMDDEKLITFLSNLSPMAMAIHIENLEKHLYEHSQREARELSRCKYLRSFCNGRRRPNKREN